MSLKTVPVNSNCLTFPAEVTISAYSAFTLRVAQSFLWGCFVSSNRLKHTSMAAKDFNMEGGDECMNFRYAVGECILPAIPASFPQLHRCVHFPPAIRFLIPLHHLLVCAPYSPCRKKWGLFVHLKAMPGKQSKALTPVPCSKWFSLLLLNCHFLLSAHCDVCPSGIIYYKRYNCRIFSILTDVIHDWLIIHAL